MNLKLPMHFIADAEDHELIAGGRDLVCLIVSVLVVDVQVLFHDDMNVVAPQIVHHNG